MNLQLDEKEVTELYQKWQESSANFWMIAEYLMTQLQEQYFKK
jgi:hypothetical protein